MLTYKGQHKLLHHTLVQHNLFVLQFDMDKFVLITGGAGGIGCAVTGRLASVGYKVFCADIGGHVCEPSDNVIPLTMDVTKGESIEQAIDVIKTHTDTLFAVINNAGIFVMESVAEIAEERFHKIIDVNLMGMYRVNKACMPLLKGNHSRIINISSDVGQYSPAPFNGPYTLSKHAVEVYSDALRRELSLLDIPVVKIRPGALKTSLLDGANRDFERLVESTQYFKQPLSKMNKMMMKELGKTNNPALLAGLIVKILETRKPRALYKLVNSRQLRLMGKLPQSIQDKIYRSMLST
jgi:NAD(P)-dependent dehydrogenase (short-subunit alcohol dehydrogenase family)